MLGITTIRLKTTKGIYKICSANENNATPKG